MPAAENSISPAHLNHAAGLTETECSFVHDSDSESIVDEDEDRRRYVVVAMDETYLDLSPGSGTLPFPSDHAHRGVAEQHCQPLGKMKHATQTGDRLVAVHAMTGDGLLCHPDFQGLVEGTNEEGFPRLREGNPMLTAELVWHSASREPDHHSAW